MVGDSLVNIVVTVAALLVAGAINFSSNCSADAKILLVSKVEV